MLGPAPPSSTTRAEVGSDVWITPANSSTRDPSFKTRHGSRPWRSTRKSAALETAVEISPGSTGKPASVRVKAIWRLDLEDVFVTSLNSSTDSRSQRRHSTAPGKGSQDTTKTPSMSMRTPFTTWLHVLQTSRLFEQSKNDQ